MNRFEQNLTGCAQVAEQTSHPVKAKPQKETVAVQGQNDGSFQDVDIYQLFVADLIIHQYETLQRVPLGLASAAMQEAWQLIHRSRERSSEVGSS